MRIDSDRTCFSLGRERLDLDRQRVRPGLPVAIELEAERLVVLPDELAAEQLLAVGAEEEPAAVVVVRPRRRIARSPSGPGSADTRPSCSTGTVAETVAGS